MTYKIAITGGIGGGKSTVAGYLGELGAVVIDTDKIARHITEPGSEILDEIREAFGDSVFHQDGSLDRAAVAGIVFSDKNALQRLNSILHPRIGEIWKKELAECGKPYAFVVIPLLFEVNLAGDFDEVWVVTAEEETRISRVMNRDGVARGAVLTRMRNQMPEDEKVKGAQLVIDTTGGFDATRAATEKALAFLKMKLKKGGIDV